MATWQHLADNLGEAWEHMTEGWRKLSRRAFRALTRYTPTATDKLSRTESEALALRSAGWGLLACEVFDDEDSVVVRLEAPGMDKDDFDLQVVNDRLIVRGEKRVTRERREGGYHISECAYGSFERAIPLPDTIDSGKARASYKRGVLRVELAKLAPSQRRSIKLTVQ